MHDDKPRWYDWLAMVSLTALGMILVFALIQVWVMDNREDTVPVWVFTATVIATIGALIGLAAGRIDS